MQTFNLLSNYSEILLEILESSFNYKLLKNLENKNCLTSSALSETHQKLSKIDRKEKEKLN